MQLTAQAFAIDSNVTTLPRYDRDALTSGILHISLGAFHRAHAAVYLDDYLNLHAENWLITAVGLMPQDRALVDAMRSQDGLYSVLERAKNQDACRMIGSIREVVHAPTETALLIARISDPAIRIISLTITEKGYCHDAERNLDPANPHWQADLSPDGNLATIHGYLLRGLQARRENQGGPVTILSCDNLPDNGGLTKKLFLQFAGLADSTMLRWIAENISFPSSMVDRITPVPDDAVRRVVAETYGLADKCPVVCETYRQWIIEDDFIAGRPRLEEVGVQFVNDVAPYEKMKVRLLNGSHSALSYIAIMLGYRHVDDALSDGRLHRFLAGYMRCDIVPTLSPVPGIDLGNYQKVLLARFSNAAIRDQVQRLAEDGSQKVRNALIPPLLYQIATGGHYHHLVFALAAWYRYLTGVDEHGAAIAIKDPLQDALRDCARMHPIDPTPFLQMEAIFDPILRDQPVFLSRLKSDLEAIHRVGMSRALDDFLIFSENVDKRD